MFLLTALRYVSERPCGHAVPCFGTFWVRFRSDRAWFELPLPFLILEPFGSDAGLIEFGTGSSVSSTFWVRRFLHQLSFAIWYRRMLSVSCQFSCCAGHAATVAPSDSEVGIYLDSLDGLRKGDQVRRNGKR